MHHIFCTIVLQLDFGLFRLFFHSRACKVQKQRLLNLWPKWIEPSPWLLF